MQQITSKDNQYIKLARSLHSKKHRLQQGCTLVEGVRLAEEAAAAADCRYALFTDAALAEPRAAALAESLQQRGVACLQVTQRLLDGVSDTEHASGVLLVVNIAPQTMPAPSGYYYAYCDNISDPGNLGAIMRNAYAAGCSGLFLSANTVDEYAPKTLRASMGAAFKLPTFRCADVNEVLEWCRKNEVTTLLTAMDGRDIRYCDTVLARPHMWILGSEAAGVSPFWRQHADLSVGLPMREGAESLNVSCAAAVLFYQSYLRNLR